MLSLNSRKLTVFFILFFAIYQIQFSFFPLNTKRLLILITLSLSLFIFNNLKHALTNKIFLQFTFIYLFFIMYITFIHGFKGNLNTSLLEESIGFFITSIIGGVFISSALISLKITRIDLLKALQFVFLVQSIFILLSFISPSFKNVVSFYIPYSEASNITDESFRARGVSNSSGAGLSLLQSFGLFISAYLYTRSKSSLYSTYLIISFSIITISLMTVGRTGLLSLVLIPFIFTLNSKKTFKFILILPVMLIFAFSLFKISYSLLSGGIETPYGTDVFDRMQSWVFDEVSIQNGNIETDTVSVLLSSHLVFSSDPYTRFFGDPNLWAGDLRLKGDIGYIRIFNSTGIIGFTIYYAMFMFLFAYLILSSTNKTEKRFFFMLAIFLMLTEFKEPFLFKHTINGVLAIIFTFYIMTTPTKSKLSGINAH